MIERANPRVSAEDFAVLRAVLQGMALRDAAFRYWSPELTLPEAKRRFETLRVSLLAAARRAGHFGDARALALDMAALPTAKSPTGPPRPSFEDFVAQIDPDGFYSQAEALELYAEQYPPDDGRFDLVGVSNGGLSAFRTAVAMPERFRSLVVFPGYSPAGDDDPDLAKLADIGVSMFVGGDDTGWRSASEQTKSTLASFGIEAELHVIEGQGHILGDTLPGSELFDALERVRGLIATSATTNSGRTFGEQGCTSVLVPGWRRTPRMTDVRDEDARAGCHPWLPTCSPRTTDSAWGTFGGTSRWQKRCCELILTPTSTSSPASLPIFPGSVDATCASCACPRW